MFVQLPVSAADADVKTLTADAQRAYIARDYVTAESKYTAALAQTKTAPAKVQIILLSNLGATYREDKKYTEAEQAFKRALTIAEKSGLLRDHTAVHAMQQYAALLRKLKRGVEAEVLEAKASGNTQILTAEPVDTARKPGLLTGPLEPSGNISVKTPKSVDSVNLEKASVAEVRELLARHSTSAVLWFFLGYKLYNANDFRSSLNAYSRCAELATAEERKSLILYSRLSLCYSKLGQYPEAVIEAKKAILDDPEQVLNYRLLAGFYDYNGEMQNAIDISQTYLDKFPNDPDHEKVVEFVEYEKTELAKPKATNEVSKLTWSLQAMPLKVYISDRYSEFSFAPKASQGDDIMEQSPADILRRAMDSWTQASGGKILFQIIDNLEQCNIEVSFTEDGREMSSDHAQGVTTFPRIAGDRRARIKLLTVDSGGHAISRASFLETSLHEFGHALGLQAHSRNAADVMYYKAHEIPIISLSTNDSERIRNIYNNRGW